MFYKLSSVLFLFAIGNSIRAQTFDLNPNCHDAYNTILCLKLDKGSALLKAEEKSNPSNLIPVYLENYIDFLTIYTTDTYEQYEQLRKNKDVRLEQLASGDRSSPYYLFTQAEVNLQWAATDLKFGEYLNALFEIRKSYKLLVENQKRFPDFKANKKSLGVLYALLGSVPDKYKWGVTLLGMEGNVEKGICYLKDLVEFGKKNDFIYQDETIIYYTFLLYHLQNQGELAWQTLMNNNFPGSGNLMKVYACAHIGIYGKHTTDALEILNKKPTDSSFIKFPLFDYLTGLAKLNSLDSDAASYFKMFLAENKGENHIKSSYQKIAWCYLLKNDTLNYFHFIEKALKKGDNLLDIDKQALFEAQSHQVPNINLLRARLLFDGGYFQKASDEMNLISLNSFIKIEDQTEFLYRSGRIYDEWNKPDTALVFYSKAIEKGKDLPRFFAANAAFESGKIYEAKGDKEKAKYYYTLCMSFENHEYKNGIDQKAKAGLNRLK